MREIQLIRRFELFSVLIAVLILIATQLSFEITHYDHLLAMDQNNQFATISSYTRALNMIFPIIARAVLLLAGWYVFHYLLFPKVKAREFEEKTFWYAALVVIFTATGLFLYHYFRKYLQVNISYNVITNIRTYSLYRKMTVFSDTVGILIVFGLYELLLQGYYHIHRQLTSEEEKIYRAVSYFFLACNSAFLIIFAIIVPLPTTLWQAPTSRVLFLGGIILQVHLLQSYLYKKVIPIIDRKDFRRFIIYSTIAILLVLVSTVIIWGCYSGFKRMYAEPIFIITAVSFFCAGIISYIRSFLSREKKVLQTQVSTTSAELATLRSQINPHFLFNALNSLYATALKENSEKTADGIQKLGDMMHFMLQENNQDRIPLSKEIEYLQNYIDIQRLRIDESQGVEIRVNIQEPDKEMYIAPMMLNPFVENAFKHGVSLQYPSWIYITLTLDATRLYFKVHNSLHTKRENDPEQDNAGVGLCNVKKRLELIYPNRHTLDIQQSDKDFFVALTLVYK